MANDASYVTHLDRRLTEASTGVSVAYNSGTGLTTWTLPYAVPTDGSQGTLAVTRRDTNVRLTVTRPTTLTVAAVGDFHTALVYIGLLYGFSYTLSPVFMRLQKGGAETRGRLQLRYLKFDLSRTTDLTVTVTAPNRTPIVYTYSNPTAPLVDTFLVKVHSRAEKVLITVSDTTAGASRIASWEWEGEYNLRSRPA